MRKTRQNKSAGKRKPNVWGIRCEWEQINHRTALIGGAICVIVAVLCVLAIGSPLYARHMLRLPNCMPPSWALFFVGLIQYFLLGWCIAALGKSASFVQIRERLHSIALLVAVVLFRLMWYLLFFGAVRPVLALIALCIVLFLSCCALHQLFFLHKTVFLLNCLQMIWGAWLLVANVAVIFLN